MHRQDTTAWIRGNVYNILYDISRQCVSKYQVHVLINLAWKYIENFLFYQNKIDYPNFTSMQIYKSRNFPVNPAYFSFSWGHHALHFTIVGKKELGHDQLCIYLKRWGALNLFLPFLIFSIVFKIINILYYLVYIYIVFISEKTKVQHCCSDTCQMQS